MEKLEVRGVSKCFDGAPVLEDISITLRSRCRHVYVPTPSKEEVEAVLRADAALGLSDEQAHWAA